MPTWAQNLLTDTHPFFYPLVFLFLLLAGLGFPISADLTLLACGYLAYQGKAQILLLTVCAISGILLGDALMYQIGKRLGLRLTCMWPLCKAITPARIERARRSFAVHGYRIVFAARFMPGVRTVFMFTSGLLNLKFWRFLLFDLVGALIVVPLILMSVTWVAGNQSALLPIFKKIQWLIVALVGALVLVKKLRPRAADASESAPLG